MDELLRLQATRDRVDDLALALDDGERGALGVVRGEVLGKAARVVVSGLLNRVSRVSRVAVWSAGGARPASVCGAVEPDGRNVEKITWHLWR